MAVDDRLARLIERPQHAGRAVLERLRELPGGPELLAVAGERGEDVDLVGGAVRDALLERAPRELDVVVAGDAHAFARELARRLDTLARESPDERSDERSDERFEGRSEVTHHERFATVLVRWEGGEIDVATRRTESYASPGALPDVRPGTPEEDLLRRDFTVNAIAVPLIGDHAGELRAVPHSLEDLAARRLRVLHERSFVEDPTRILRLARYRARLGFDVEPHTAELADRAIAEGALRTVSGPRLGAEVRLALAEDDPIAALAEMDRMGVFEAWEPGVCFDEHLVRAALEILPPDGDPRLLIVASMLLELIRRMEQEDTESSMWGFLYDLELPSGQAQRAFSAAILASCCPSHLDGSETTDEMLELIEGAAVEGLALGGALGDMTWGPRSYTRGVIEEWLGEHRHIELHITGDDLLAAGVPEGPEIGRRLDRVFALRMTGLLEEGREAELSAALADDA